jgi:hypothetical protein
MSSEKISQQQSEVSETYDELIPSHQKRDVRAERRRSEEGNDNKRNVVDKSPEKHKATKDKGHGLVDISERSKRARSSG